MRRTSIIIDNGAASSFIIPLKNGENQFLISDKHTVSVIEWNGIDAVAKIVREVFTVETAPEYTNNNWNIGKASPTNSRQFYGGTFRGNICSSESGSIASLYKFTKSKCVKSLVKCLKLSGGLDWNVEESLFYHIDSCDLVIREYNWDSFTGNICA